jgi:hypothetical protein
LVQGAEYFGSPHCQLTRRPGPKRRVEAVTRPPKHDHRMKRIIEDEQLSPADVRRALDEIIASAMFRDSPQLANFLRFIVEASLDGDKGRVKGYTIGVEALGRSESFDPQIDPIVRVEATRLRRTLERYYAGPGAADSIVFGLSRGSYVPTIRRRRESRGSGDSVGRSDAPATRADLAAAVAIILIAISLSRYPEEPCTAAPDRRHSDA